MSTRTRLAALASALASPRDQSTRTTSASALDATCAGDTVLQTSTAPAANILLCTLGLGSVSTIYSLVTLAITST